MAVKWSSAKTPRSLSVENFSALKYAKIELKPLTIITGPQASGKSLLCKLSYFFQDFGEEMYRSVSEGNSFADFSRHLAERFNEWFPASAWGDQKFVILYEVEHFQIRVTRLRTH